MNGNSFKSRIGTLFLSSGWFHDVGMQNQSLVKHLGRSVREVVQHLKPGAEVVFPEEVHSIEKARQAATEFMRQKVDLVVICFLTWTEDAPLIAALEKLYDVPLLFWCYTPFSSLPDKIEMLDMLRSCGGVGILQCSGLLNRRGMKCDFVFGEPSETVINGIVRRVRCASVRRMLKQLTIGLLPQRCEQMATTYVDEFRLRADLGTQIRPISIQEYLDVLNALNKKKIEKQKLYLLQNYRIGEEVSEESIEISLRASLALDALASRYNLGAIALNEISEEMHQRIGARPGLWLPELFENDSLEVSNEGDIAAALGMSLIRFLCGRPVLYTEPLTFDVADNTICFGHAGFMDTSTAPGGDSIEILADFEYKNSDRYVGAMSHFVAARGPVTLVNCVDNGQRLQLVALRGESIADAAVLSEGYPHALVRLDIPVEEFFGQNFEIGVSQHWLIVHCELVESIRMLASYLPFDIHILETKGAKQ